MVELEIVCKETIKPPSSTPSELRNHPLCLIDQQAPNHYIMLLYFYDNRNTVDPGRLKDSLSKALTVYYPFAGRLQKGGNSIDCNDMGAMYSEGKLRCPMSEVMNNKLQLDQILKLVCLDHDTNGNDTDPRFNPLLSVQLFHFECGGAMMSASCYHKVADLASLTNFVNDWASIARSSGGDMLPAVTPLFNAASFFRPELDAGGNPSGDEGSEAKGGGKKVFLKRLVFEGSKIEALKAMVSEKVANPTRVQILTAFIYKAALSAKILVTGNWPTTSLLQTVNIRSRMEPPLEEKLIGNILSFFIASSTTEEGREMEIWDLVGDMKRSFEEFCREFPKNCRAEEWSWLYKLHAKEKMERLGSGGGDHVVYCCSSWCKFPLYEADFGWGKPIWITVPDFDTKNLIILMDARDGEGVEAMVSLEEEEMAVFEQNQELLSFCELRT
ncbi:vinorine synthase-like [Cucurbita moschata]|uniref:Vinorine synthase-like n=1 Tax=Cucurbita moschata TaxID=3662 RepID=A0A6J1G9W8_CUCMO|nr:vinorine synthase-like [Cucurbita moschata]XP_022948440.1 vinorine synthase-like [Cucurbita moschata]XP_022948441.1 vinorine synthase-like [Cucurbita moschata]